MLAVTLDQIQSMIKQIADEEMAPRFAKVDRQLKSDGSIVTEVDYTVQTRVIQALSQLTPGVKVLSEEIPQATRESIIQSQDPIWCLDPIDGTSNFFVGVPYFCVSLALMHQGETLMGVVYDPCRQECFSAEKGKGAWLNDQPLKLSGEVPALANSIAMVDFKRLPTALAVGLVTEKPYASQRSFGSVALEWCWLADRRSHVYLHGRQTVWDYAAGYLVFNEAGGQGCSSTLTGGQLSHDLVPNTAVGAISLELFLEWQQCLFTLNQD